jgi:hypothetical protein
MQLTQFFVDERPHNRDGLVLHGWDGNQQVIGFISRRVIADWVDPSRTDRNVMLSAETLDLLREWWKARPSRHDAQTPLQDRWLFPGNGLASQ